jgi:chemotaxis protein MotA
MKFSWFSFILFVFGISLFSIGLLETIGKINFEWFNQFFGNNQFINLAGIFILIGGLITSLSISFPSNLIKSTFGQLKYFFSSAKSNDQYVIEEVTSWVIPFHNNKVEFINSLEEKYINSKLPHKFLIELFYTRETDEEIEKLVYLYIKNTSKNYRNYSKVFKMLGITSPAIGMIGTLLGLVYMLGSLDDPTKIGPGLALGLIVTLYGVLLSNLFFLPFSRKLNELESSEIQKLQMISIGISLIKSNKSEKFIKDYFDLILNS